MTEIKQCSFAIITIHPPVKLKIELWKGERDRETEREIVMTKSGWDTPKLLTHWLSYFCRETCFKIRWT